MKQKLLIAIGEEKDFFKNKFVILEFALTKFLWDSNGISKL